MKSQMTQKECIAIIQDITGWKVYRDTVYPQSPDKKVWVGVPFGERARFIAHDLEGLRQEAQEWQAWAEEEARIDAQLQKDHDEAVARWSHLY